MEIWLYAFPDYSEYPAHCDERRAFISGFNGSAGCAVVTLDKASLFTDGRYFLQAGQQIDEYVAVTVTRNIANRVQ
jgi:Xaa-Pro aminopeptidase